MRLQDQFGLAGGGRGGRQFPGDAQPFGRGARLPAHVGQREQRVGEHAGLTSRPGAFDRGAGQHDGPRQITMRAIGELARQRRGQQPSRRAAVGRPLSVERGERLLQQRDHLGSRRLGQRRYPVDAEGRPGEQLRVAGRAGARRRPGQRGPRLLAVPGPPQRVPVLAHHHQVSRCRVAGDVDGPAQPGGRLVEGGPGGRFPGRLGQRGDRPVRSPSGHARLRW